MNNELKKRAEELASRQYTVIVVRDTTTEGEPIFIALNPELEGCYAQGETAQAAEVNLSMFRVDFILHLLEHGLPVPEPAWAFAEEAAFSHVCDIDVFGGTYGLREDSNVPGYYVTFVVA